VERSLPVRARLTRQRRAILDAIDETEGAFTAAEIHRRARKAYRRLGLATTYRTLELLRESGGLHALRSAGTPAYVRCHPEHHHHLVCVSCGSVEETELCAAPSADELRRRYGFSPQTHELEIYGTCRRCAA
jgi:Fur family transcriptional regulator, ferric uptake regulator